MTSYKDTALLDISENIATITLNRPQSMNAFNLDMMNRVIELLDETDANDEVRAVIVTGAGERAFCAGADLNAGSDTFDIKSGVGANEDMRVGDIMRDGGGLMTLRIFRSLKPIIGAINGAAVGVGATMQLPMDIRIASTKARFGFVFARRGIAPEAASSWFLPRVVGISQALEWCYSGRVFGAEEAKAGGLVRSLHEPEDLLPAARELAKGFTTECAPVSVSLIRQMMWRGLCLDHPMYGHMADSRAIQSRGASADSYEGVASFLEKRPPVFPDRVSQGLPDVFPFWEEPSFR